MRVLMVCLGNICRSPLAHGILQKEIDVRGLDWSVDSAGTSGWHNGELPDSRSIEVAEKHGIDLRDQRSRKFVREDYDNFDLILAMDSSNFSDIISLARNEQDRSKVRLMLNYSFPKENRAVPDPYYSGGFDYVYDLLKNAVEQLIQEHS